MKFEDDTQNLKARMAIIHGLVIAILAVLNYRAPQRTAPEKALPNVDKRKQ